MEQGTNKSLFTLITVVIFGIFLSLSYWLFQDQFKSVLGSVLEGTSELASGFFNKTDGESDTQLGYYGDLSIVPNPASDFTFDPETGTILKYIGLSEKVVVPYSIDGVFVENIGAESFRDNINLTGVTFPNTIKSIGNYAFRGTSLETITLPDSVETLGNYSFYNIPTLTTVTTGNGLKTIGSNVFYNSGLTSIELPEGLTTISDRAFRNMKLEFLTIPSTVTTLGEDIASNTLTLKHIILPQTLKSKVTTSTIFGSTFDNSAALTYYSDLLVTTSGDYILNNKGILVKYLGSESNITIPSIISGLTVESIGVESFRDNINLTGVTFPNTIKSIGNYAFRGTSLETVTLPDSVETLGDYSFYNIPTLTTVTTGNGLKTIGSNVFYNSGLTSIELNKGLETIGSNVFYGTGLTSIELPEGLITISDRAFRNMKLEFLTIPSTVTTLGKEIASNTLTLKTINLPTSLKSKVTTSTIFGSTFDNSATLVYY